MKRYKVVDFNTEEVIVNNVSQEEAQAINQRSKDQVLLIEIEKPNNPLAFAAHAMVNEDIAIIQDGMTLRDYYAAHAPSEIPEWFETEIDLPELKQPKAWWDYEEGDLKKKLEGWHKDPIFDFTEEDGQEAMEYQKKWDKYRSDRSELRRVKKSIEYIKWRYAYADLMLVHRSV